MHFVDTMLFIGRDAFHTKRPQRTETIHHQFGRLKATLHHYRFHHIQFHLSSLTCHCDTKFITDHLEADLVHHFRNHRIHLARHNG